MGTSTLLKFRTLKWDISRIIWLIEYLERRFSPGIRLVGTVLFLLNYVLYLSLALYAPSLALEAVAGVPLIASIVSAGAVCTFYTTLGGMRAVIWTDVFQSFVMVIGLVVMVSIGTTEVGGLGNVINIVKKGQRSTLFDFNPDPTVRSTFWSITVGSTLTFLPAWTTSQVCVQRFLSARSLRDVKKALYTNIFGLGFFMSLCVLTGLVLYAVYADCDPKTAKEITSNDQIVAYFIVHKLSHLTGVPGLFTACLFSGALSTASSGLNSISAIFVEDIVRKIKPDIVDKAATVGGKVVACTVGVFVIGGAYLISVLGSMVLQLMYMITGVVGAPYFGLFTLGILTRRATWKGAYVGVLFGVGLNTWISVGRMLYPAKTYPAPVSIKGCSFYNSTIANNSSIASSGTKGYDFPLAKLYSLSHMWYTGVAVFVTCLTGYLASLLLVVSLSTFMSNLARGGQIIVSHVSAACLEYTGRKQLSCKNCLERRCRNFKHTAELSLYSSASKTDIEEKDPRGKVDDTVDDRLIFSFKNFFHSLFHPVSDSIDLEKKEIELDNKKKYSSEKDNKDQDICYKDIENEGFEEDKSMMKNTTA